MVSDFQFKHAHKSFPIGLKRMTEPHWVVAASILNSSAGNCPGVYLLCCYVSGRYTVIVCPTSIRVVHRYSGIEVYSDTN